MRQSILRLCLVKPRWQCVGPVQAIFKVDAGSGCVEKNAFDPIGLKAFDCLASGRRLTVLQIDKLAFRWTGV